MPKCALDLGHHFFEEHKEGISNYQKLQSTRRVNNHSNNIRVMISVPKNHTLYGGVQLLWEHWFVLQLWFDNDCDKVMDFFPMLFFSGYSVGIMKGDNHCSSIQPTKVIHDIALGQPYQCYLCKLTKLVFFNKLYTSIDFCHINSLEKITNV